MAVPSPDAFADLLSALDYDDFVSFVADVWRARGRSVTRDGDVLIASGGGGTRRVLPVVRRRFRGLEPPLDRRERFDLVVDRDGRAAEETAERGVEYVGPTGIRSSILYGIDRDDADRLFREYFGRPVDDGEPPRPPTRATTGRGDGDNDRDTGRSIDTAALIERGSALVLVLLVVAAGATALGVDPFGPGGAFGRGGSVDDNVTSGNTSGNFSVGAVGGPGLSHSYPPGVSERSVNGSVLAAAHARALENQSYELRLVSASESRTNGTKAIREHYSRSVYRANQTSFSGSLKDRLFDHENERHIRLKQYANESHRFTTVVYNKTGRTRYVETQRNRSNTPLAWTETYVRMYIGRSNATVTPIPESHGGYQIVVTRAPRAAEIRTRTPYKATAVVNGSGFVSRLEVDYTTVDNSSGTQVIHFVRFSFQFTRVGNVTVSKPPWVDDARRRLRGSGSTSVVVDNRTTT